MCDDDEEKLQEPFYNKGIDKEQLENEYKESRKNLKYKTPEDLSNAIELYFRKVKKEEKIPTISGLAYSLGISTVTLRKYELMYSDPVYNELIRRAKQRIEITNEEYLYTKAFNGAKFSLQNNFGWADKQEVEVKKKLEDFI